MCIALHMGLGGHRGEGCEDRWEEIWTSGTNVGAAVLGNAVALAGERRRAR